MPFTLDVRPPLLSSAGLRQQSTLGSDVDRREGDLYGRRHGGPPPGPTTKKQSLVEGIRGAFKVWDDLGG